MFLNKGFFTLEEHGRCLHQRDLGPIHTTTEKFEIAPSFLRLSLMSTLIRNENGGVWKRSSNRRNLKLLALRFGVNRKHF